jgi:hypothetical protein
METLKVGDYVQTCSLMPGILQKIIRINREPEDWLYEEVEEISFDRAEVRKSYIGYDVEVFYPHYKEKSPEYTGGSECCLTSCGVERITKEYFDCLMNLGEEKLKVLWDAHRKVDMYWDDFVQIYASDPKKIMKFIPIKKVIGNGIVEFKDNSLWMCKKEKRKNTRVKDPKIGNGDGKRKFKTPFHYVPLEKIKNTNE